MRGMPRTLTTRVSRLEAQHACHAQGRGFRIVYGADTTEHAETLASDPASEDDARLVLVMLYSSRQPESLI